MDNNYVLDAVFNEFARRIEEEDKRQDLRITALERGVQEISRITISVEKLATNMEQMMAELNKQGQRLEKIEERPVKRWDTVVSGIIAGAVGLLIGLMSSGIIK